MTNPLMLVPWEQGNAFLNASVLELAYKMVLKTIARKGLRDRDPSLAPYRIGGRLVSKAIMICI